MPSFFDMGFIARTHPCPMQLVAKQLGFSASVIARLMAALMESSTERTMQAFMINESLQIKTSL